MSGSTIRDRNFSRGVISITFTTGWDNSNCVVVPSNRITARPFSLANKSSGELAIRSIILPSSASFSVKALASVTAVEASSALRPRLLT